MGFGYSVFVNNTLLRFYSSCSGSVGCSRKLFDEMLERDVVSWNTMICAYMGHGEMEFAMGLFDLMPERNVVSWNSVVTGFCKAGEMRLAGLIFERMIVRNEFSWNCMISGYARVGDMVNARLVFDQMPEKTVISWTAMITGYANVRDVMSASVFFNLMPVKNVVSWNAMIAGYVHNHVFDQALNVFHQMLMSNSDGGSCRPDEATLTTALSACAHLGSLEQGKWIESYIKKYNIGLSVSLGNTLIDMFAKCGDIENAKLVFNGMRNRSIFTWTTLVSGLAFNGLCREALDLFDTLCNENDKTEPDDVIFIAVLSACTHGGLVEEGKRVFHQMMRQFGIEPRIEHYGCMVDLLSRAGKVEEALSFVMSMPMEPNAIIWATLLGSCQVYGNRELVQVVSKRILGLEPSNPAYLMLISNSNASMGRWEDVLNVRATMRNRGIEKVPGCSSIQVGNKVLEFLVKDTRHERTSEIYESLHSLNDHLKASVDN
ncbi:hypothetical protein GIB67_038948 [Kingdonia uniflora]|uniref:Chlororespiratory reduction 4 n=1 Tax=Kingdonia uniflora TaxID=39325 RepID=A0A7J7P8P4_9MAGN|nr:hypothetical protein GIB67_038948 [Kingdonia uniflora]